MEFEIIFRIISAVVAIVGIAKIIYDIEIVNKSKLREEYKFAKEFFEEQKNDSDLHPFVKEKGYQAIAGNTTCPPQEVVSVLSLENPSQRLKDYVSLREYLRIINTDGEIHLEFSEKYSCVKFRQKKKIKHILEYSIFIFIALTPTLAPLKYLTLLFLTLPGYGYFALASLNSYIKIERAEKLVNNQKKHISK